VPRRKEHHIFAHRTALFVGTGCEIAGAAGGCGWMWKTPPRRSLRSSGPGFPHPPTTPLENSPPLPPPVFLSPLENRPPRPPLAKRSQTPVSHNSTSPTTTISFSLPGKQGVDSLLRRL